MLEAIGDLFTQGEVIAAGNSKRLGCCKPEIQQLEIDVTAWKAETPTTSGSDPSPQSVWAPVATEAAARPFSELLPGLFWLLSGSDTGHGSHRRVTWKTGNGPPSREAVRMFARRSLTFAWETTSLC